MIPLIAKISHSLLPESWCVPTQAGTATTNRTKTSILSSIHLIYIHCRAAADTSSTTPSMSGPRPVCPATCHARCLHSGAGGWWANPRHWKRNTVLLTAACAVLSVPIFSFSAANEVAPHACIRLRDSHPPAPPVAAHPSHPVTEVVRARQGFTAVGHNVPRDSLRCRRTTRRCTSCKHLPCPFANSHHIAWAEEVMGKV